MSVPTFMTAIRIREPGPPDVLEPVERPTPEPGDGEVLIQVAAAGVNRPDLMQRAGRYPPPPGAPDIPGLEVAGTIVAVGPEVASWTAGQNVCALLAGGGYAEFAAAPAPQCLPVPRGLTLVEAAALPETFFTVWTNVFERGRLAAGESLLVHGGSSGIGTSAIQMARARGARVFATAGTAEKCAACERLGAERAVNYREEDFVAAIRHLTGGRGVDVVLDMVGGDYLRRNLEVLAPEGRLVQIAFLEGSTVEVNLWTLMAKRLTITGSTLRPRTVAQKGAIADAVRREIWPLVEGGRIRPVIHATFPLARAAEAHRLLESGTHIGKVVLTVTTGQGPQPPA
jgi:putative PIG3 family NAD(P)H quinone oxidoreductase